MHFRLHSQYAEEAGEGCSREVLSLFLRHVSNSFYPVDLTNFGRRVTLWLWKGTVYRNITSKLKCWFPFPWSNTTQAHRSASEFQSRCNSPLHRQLKALLKLHSSSFDTLSCHILLCSCSRLCCALSLNTLVTRNALEYAWLSPRQATPSMALN